MAMGKISSISLNPLDYTIGFFGEEKIGKTTLVRDILKELTHDPEASFFFEFGLERGTDCAEGIKNINIRDWDSDYDEVYNEAGFVTVCEDIIQNKSTDYPNLKVVVWDTYDLFIPIAELESVNKWNKFCREKATNDSIKKITKDINGAWGGFQRGQAEAFKLMNEYKDKLKKVGVETWIIGHTKIKDETDETTGEIYRTLNFNQSAVYAKGIKGICHVIATGYYNRKIESVEIGKVNPVTKKKQETGNVVSCERKIKFRDSNNRIESGGRLGYITEEVNWDANEVINAIKNAILKEKQTYGISVEEANKQQKEKDNIVCKKAKEEENKNKRDSIVKQIVKFVSENKNDIETVSRIIQVCKQHGFSNPTEIKTLEQAEEILSFCK